MRDLWFKSALRAALPDQFRESVWRFRLRRQIRLAFSQSTPPAIVYSAQKTASTTVAEALRGLKGQPVFHFHNLDAVYMSRIAEAMRWRELTNNRHDADGLRALGMAFTQRLIHEQRRLRVVSLVRDPIARNVSRYFENLDVLWDVEQAHKRLDIDRLLAEFHERFDHDEGINWFRREFSTLLGIDVYAHPFERERGFMRIDDGPYEVLIMRHDLNDRLKEKCLAELVGCASISVVSKNVGAEKSYADAYREFLRRLKLSDKYVDRQLGSEFARHFYGSQELEHLRAKWLGREWHGRPAREIHAQDARATATASPPRHV